MRLRFDIVETIKAGLFYMLGILMVSAFLTVLIVALILIGASYKPARAQDYPNCREFGVQIPGACCCTNNCCTEAEPGEFRHLGGDQYRSTVTGQTIKRTGWSSDGRTVKCACDLGNDGRWFKHPKANVRCLFMPMPAM